MAYVTLLECGSIQNYVFASNRLREAIGGSYLIKAAFEIEDDLATEGKSNALLLKALRASVSPARLVKDWKKQSGLTMQLKNRETTEEGPLAEVLYVGGGNAALLFANAELARTMVRHLSSDLLATAPGLILLVGHAEWRSEQPLADVIEEAYDELHKLKDNYYLAGRQNSLPVTRSCATTGQAATICYPSSELNQAEPDYLSASAAARRAAADRADNEANRWLHKQAGGKLYDFPTDLENLGGREGADHIAVVHIDGNGVGARLLGCLKKYKGQGEDTATQALVAELRQFSLSISQAAQAAQDELLQNLIASVPDYLEKELDLKPLSSSSEARYLPLRLLIAGGDDLTFVCEGRLGMTLAVQYLRTFSNKRDAFGKPLSACAGVVIARNHFPLARAYKLSEELCRNAKIKAREEAEHQIETSWLDFQVLFSGLTGVNLASLRQPAGVFWRPYRVAGATVDDYSWSIFEEQLYHLKNNWSRSQVKGLQEALLSGESRTATWLNQAKLRGRELLPLADRSLVSGWFNKKTPYFDPIECLDFYLEVKSADKNNTRE